MQIKRFFSEPWFGFCNFTDTAPIKHLTGDFAHAGEDHPAPALRDCNVPKEVNTIHDYQRRAAQTVTG
ncbi:Uncharacterized protein ABJ99_2319 [Pseudomonas syringae pv. cilantro]|uniref:Uncharacterized protein n=1 Tax=Pseudomonas syringae pv. cilantro TaxID=81035 RepID=A0A0N0X7E3_PSESX|nr:Uncharacterized protein ABJ99_2319 [Pseudomonas syringae pv. cilantro]